jgi:hypothetical protein
VEDFEEKQSTPRDFDEVHLLQHEYDDIVQKVESDDKLRQVQQEAKLLMHSWPDQWFSKSKRVPRHQLDPETEEVVMCQACPVLCITRFHIISTEYDCLNRIYLFHLKTWQSGFASEI